MYAHVCTVAIAPGAWPTLRDLCRTIVARALQQQPGFRHLYLLVDEDEMTTLRITFWDSAEHLLTAEPLNVRQDDTLSPLYVDEKALGHFALTEQAAAPDAAHRTFRLQAVAQAFDAGGLTLTGTLALGVMSATIQRDTGDAAVLPPGNYQIVLSLGFP